MKKSRLLAESLGAAALVLVVFGGSRAGAEMSRHLATINSNEENDFITGMLSRLGPRPVAPDQWNFWIGGYQPLGSNEPGGAWRWVTDEPFTYTHWSTVEPNNYGGSEDSLSIMGIPADTGTTGFLGRWNDRSSDASIGYVVESVNTFDGSDYCPATGHYYQVVLNQVTWPQAEAVAESIPEPSTFALLGVGAIALLACGWRRRAAWVSTDLGLSSPRGGGQHE
jgi:hypothetical protein